MLVSMAKIHVIAHRRDLDAVLGALHRLGVVHLVDVTGDSSVRLPPLSVDDDHLHRIEEARYLRARLQALLSMVNQSPRHRTGEVPTADLEALRRELDEVQPEVEQRTSRIAELRVELETLPRHVESLRRLLPLVPGPVALEDYETAAVVLEARHAEVLATLDAELTGLLRGNFEIISDRIGPDTLGALVVFPKRASREVLGVLGREQVSRVRLPAAFETLTFREAVTAMERRLLELPLEIEREEEALADLVRDHPHWPDQADGLDALLDQLGAIRSLGGTRHTFVLSGWVPRRAVGSVTEALEHDVGGDAIVELVAPEPGERPPVLFENPAAARPFERLIRLLSLPRYGTVDPTVLMTIFLPLFFGIMLGDVAYGLMLLGIAWLVGRRFGPRWPVAADLSRILAMSAGWAVIWGVVYGEFLGDLGHRLWDWEPLWVNREEALTPLLVFAVAIGAAHIVLGLLLGVWQASRDRDRGQLARRLGMLVALIGLFLIAGVAADALPDGFMTPGVAVLVVGTVVLMAVEGPMGLLLGPLELAGTIGNVLSYLRLAAIGLASVYLARVANELGALGPIWMGILVAALFHALNLALGAFSPTIQSLRLHYVEFFGKFFAEGGEPYRPFGPDRAGSGRPAPNTTTRSTT